MMLRRRRLLGAGCAHCAGLWALGAAAQSPADTGAPGPDAVLPPRFAAPDASTDEGGLWAMMQREETRLRRSPFLLKDAALQSYLLGLVCKLAGEHCPDVRVYAVRNPFFNASMAPNGMMQVWSGLLLRVDNEAQLATILAHEIGHYLKRHTLDQLRDAKSRSSFMVFMAMFGVVGLIGQMAALAGAFGFSRDQEREADRIGMALMRQAGYDPREAAKVWANLLAELSAGADGDPTRNSPLFATHPPSDERRDTLSRLAEGASGGRIGQAEFDQQLAGLQAMLLEDELRRGRHPETLALLDRLVRRSPQRADLLYFRGETRRLRAAPGDDDAALADLQAAVALGGEPAETHRALGYLHQKRQQGAASRAAFARYLDMAPQAADAAMVRSYLNESPT